MKNPYYDEAQEIGLNQLYIDFTRQKELQYKYAWSIPSDEYAQAIVDRDIRHIIEIGAGTGYWAWFLSQYGIKVEAFDDFSWSCHVHGSFHPVKGIDELNWQRTPYSALMFVWPPYGSPMAENYLKQWQGRHVLYVGESQGGCTANNGFYDYLQDWDCDCYTQENWGGIHSYQYIYRKVR